MPLKKIKTILVEDEPKSLLTIQTLLDRYCPEVEVIGTARNVAEGVEKIGSLHPDLIFLDISMPDGNAFDLLNRLTDVSFEVIFITAFNDYALKAFEFSALHYLLKPINYQDLQMAVERYIKMHPHDGIRDRLEILNQSLQNKFIKISLPTAEGLSVIEIDTIVRIEASSNYSIFYFQDGDSLVVSKTMNQFEEILNGLDFYRIHNTHIINLQYLKKYHKGRGGMVVLTDGTKLAVSVGRKRGFMEHLNTLSLNLGENNP